MFTQTRYTRWEIHTARRTHEGNTTHDKHQEDLVASHYALLLVYTHCIVFSSYVLSRPDDGPALGPKHVFRTIKTLPPSSCVLTLPFYLTKKINLWSNKIRFRSLAYRHTDIQTYRHTDIQTYWHTDIQTYRHTDIQTYRHTDIQTYRHTDIPTYIQTYRHTEY
jgi:hypothetical protein